MKMEFKKGSETIPAELERTGQTWVLKGPGGLVHGEILRWEGTEFVFRVDGRITRGIFYDGGGYFDVHLPQGNFRLNRVIKKRGGDHAAHGGLSSPMPGKIIKVMVGEGDAVNKGDLLLVLEAMKMEHRVVSPREGKVGRIHFKEGERVGQDVELLEILG